MKNCITSLLCLTISISCLYSQSAQLDSLEQLLSTNIPDSAKFEIYMQLIWPKTRDDSEAALVLTDDLLALSEKMQSDRVRMTAYYYYGTTYKNMGRFSESLDYFNKHYEHFLEKKDTVQIANVLYQLAAVKSEMGAYAESMELYNECIRLDEYLGRRSSMAATVNARAVLFKTMNQLDRALNDYMVALKIFEEEGDLRQQSISHLNIANVYGQQERYQLGLEEFEQAEKLAQESDYAYIQAYIYDNRAKLYERMDDDQKALSEYEKALKMRQKLNHLNEQAITEINLSRLHNKLNHSASAISFAHQALDKAVTEKMQPEMESAHLMLSEAYKDMGNYKQALQHHESFAAIRDTILNKDITEQIAEMDAKFETSKKEAEIDRLSLTSQLQAVKLNQQKLGLGIAIGVVGLLLFLLRNIYKKSQEIEKQKNIIQKSLKEKNFLLKEIHHRVKNNLQVISSLLNLQAKTVTDETAQTALDEGRHRVRSMALIHQNLYQKDNLSGINMQVYLSQLANELLENYKVGDNDIQLELNIQDVVLDVDSAIPVGLIVNELMSNSLKYGFPNDRSGAVRISLSEHDSILDLQVSDTGIGFDKEELSDDSFGHQLITSFADRLQAEYQLETSNGTHARFLIKDFKLAA